MHESESSRSISGAYVVQEFIRNRPHSRIVCTLGPSSSSPDTIRALIEAGMSVARINTSHASLEFHAACIETVRAVSDEMGIPIGILADLPGPKYRLGIVPHGAINLADGDVVTLLGDESDSDGERCAAVLPAGLHRDVRPGDQLIVADGTILLRVQSVHGVEVACEVASGGVMESRKAVAIPGRTSALAYLTEETVRALDFAVEQRVDFIGLSYIRGGADLATVKEHLRDRAPRSQLIAKIELRDAVASLEEILDGCDGVMVARGDLGVEVPISEVPGLQKLIIRRSNERGKVVITATQMLESMINSATPTRAEVADVANAVLDGTDAIMLSAETSIGAFPVKSTRVMAEAAREAEKMLDRDWLARRRTESTHESVDEAIAYTACWTSSTLDAKVILAFTESGSTAARVASYRPSAAIVALFRDEVAGRRLSLRWGVTALQAPRISSVQWMFREGSFAAIQSGFAREGDLAVAVVGMPIGRPGNTNLLRVIRLPEPEPRFGRELIDDAVRGE